ncbi:hypothetical protein, partial [Escherichia coli]|uniref:hypothetical protein n=1 Tax=Escherichia coli TaxID=562 RepID=UPI0010CB06E1
AYCHALQALVAMPQSWWGVKSSLALPTVSARVTQAPATTALLHHGLRRQAAMTPTERGAHTPTRASNVAPPVPPLHAYPHTRAQRWSGPPWGGGGGGGG